MSSTISAGKEVRMQEIKQLYRHLELDSFFTVTTSGHLWRIKSRNGQIEGPFVEQFSNSDKPSISVDYTERGGAYVAVGNVITIYRADENRQLRCIRYEGFSEDYRVGYLSPVVALFLSYDAARQCQEAVAHDLKRATICDPKWKEPTIETLEQIGSVHAVFIPCMGKHFSILASYRTHEEPKTVHKMAA